jgi:hypothetical protein
MPFPTEGYLIHCLPPATDAGTRSYLFAVTNNGVLDLFTDDLEEAVEYVEWMESGLEAQP